MIKVRARKPHRRKITSVRIRRNFAVLVEGKVRKLLEVNYQSYDIFYLVEIQAHKTITNLRRYHRSGAVRRYAQNYLVMGGLAA